MNILSKLLWGCRLYKDSLKNGCLPFVAATHWKLTEDEKTEMEGVQIQ